MKKYFLILFLSFLFGCSSSDEENQNGSLPEVYSDYIRTPAPEFLTDSTITELKIDTSTGNFFWKVSNDKMDRTYFIEEFRWNKYFKLGEVKGGKNNYSFQVPIDSGIYCLFVKYKEDKQSYGQKIEVPVSNDVYCLTVCKSNGVYFSKPTRFEVYNKFGKRIRKGYDDKALTEGLYPDVYYLNYGNKTTEFIVKR